MNKFKVKLIVICIFFSFVLPIPWSDNQALKIHVLDVGQGDSTLIITPLNQKVLIDGGPNGQVIEQLDEVLGFWDRKIDILMLTHPDADHVSGLVDVIDRYRVEKILLTPIKGDNSGYTALISRLKVSDIKQINFIKGDRLTTGSGVSISGLWPPPKTNWADSRNSINQLSQVVVLKYRDFSMLFTGDIDTQIADSIMKSGSLTDVDVVKIPHHGSKYGLKRAHLNVLSPMIGTVSVGSDNRFGHPSPVSLDILKEVKSEVYRTDINGRISIEIDFAGINVIPEKT